MDTSEMSPTSLQEDLDKFLAAINSLPPSCLTGRRDGPLAKYLSPGLTKDADPKPTFPCYSDGQYFTFNSQWENVFQKKPGDPPDKMRTLMSRGKHGLILAHAWAAHYARVVEANERELIQIRVQAVLTQITES
jgi:hypothetical protein